MLRITTHNEAKVMRFVVEGKLVGPWVTELEKCWRAAISSEPRTQIQPIEVDLTEVTFIDDSGKQLLAWMRQGGARLTGVGLIAEFICGEIEKAMCAPVTNDESSVNP